MFGSKNFKHIETKSIEECREIFLLVSLFYVFLCFYDVSITYAVFKYNPSIFINGEMNSIAVSHSKGDLFSTFILITAMIFPLIGYYLFFLWYKQKNDRIHFLMFYCFSFVFYATSYLHLLGGLSWLIC
jgi:hypothetical protein